MDFAARKQEAIERVRTELRKELAADTVLIHAWRCTEGRPKALEHWLFAVLPDMHPEKAREAVEGEERESLKRAENEGLKKARH